MRLLLALALLVAAPAAAPAAQTAPDDRHAGYYYPPPQSFETYKARTAPLADSDRRRRVGFSVELAARMLQHPYPPDFVLFVKGEQAEKMIIVSLREGALDTIYRARAALAQMTLIARGSPLFAQLGVEDYFVFYDLCRLMGFDQITVSDGQGFAHQITLASPD
jgi:hypothetical protein